MIAFTHATAAQIGAWTTQVCARLTMGNWFGFYVGSARTEDFGSMTFRRSQIVFAGLLVGAALGCSTPDDTRDTPARVEPSVPRSVRTIRIRFDVALRWGRATIYRASMSDTTPDAARFYHERLRALSAAERLHIAASLSSSVRSLAEAGIRLRFPAIGERELAARLAARLYGDAIAARYFPDVPLSEAAT